MAGQKSDTGTPSVPPATPGRSGVVRELRSPPAAAIAGIAFAVLLSIAVVMLQWAIPARDDPSEWLTDGSHRRVVAFAMGLVPYAGIAFLWFIGVIRSRLGDQEDKLFATAFLGSGLLFVAMLFAASADVGALLALYNGPDSVSPEYVRQVGA